MTTQDRTEDGKSTQESGVRGRAKELKGNTRDGAQELPEFGKGGGKERLGRSINDNTDLVLGGTQEIQGWAAPAGSGDTGKHSLPNKYPQRLQQRECGHHSTSMGLRWVNFLHSLEWW